MKITVVVTIFQWFVDRNLSVTYDDITVSATCSSEDADTQIYNIFIQQHEAQDIQSADVEYINVASVKVRNINVNIKSKS